MLVLNNKSKKQFKWLIVKYLLLQEFMKERLCVFWFRRDLRLNDNAGLYHALKSGYKVLPIFIFDTSILEKLEDKEDRRVDFIHQSLHEINKQLIGLGSSIKVYNGYPTKAFESLLKEFNIEAVYANHDYEPAAIKRDEEVSNLLSNYNVAFHSFKDQCFFEKNEITKDDGTPYTVFTPYSRKWKQKFTGYYAQSYPNKKYFKNFLTTQTFTIPTLEELGFKKTEVVFSIPKLDSTLITKYKEQRDFPAIHGTTRISMHLRFGTISIREMVRVALSKSETWLNELIWRDFYMMILFQFPRVVTRSFKKEYDMIPWRNNETEFEKWCKGETGFPIVDAGMRELNSTGFMHNRVRMITASFLVKDLLIDWRWGEAYFAQKLNDFDLSANNGGWQWASGGGCDAAPYFRIFNPTEQQKRFDPDFAYIKKWLPEFGTSAYPLPIVDHAAARSRTLSVFKEALSESKQLKLL